MAKDSGCFIIQSSSTIASFNEDIATLETTSVSMEAVLFDEKLANLLVEAVNNRTRERNYFRKYIELLEGEISEDEFEKEIIENEDEYVRSLDKSPDLVDLKLALSIAHKIKDIKTLDDFTSLFSFNEQIVEKQIPLLECQNTQMLEMR